MWKEEGGEGRKSSNESISANVTIACPFDPSPPSIPINALITTPFLLFRLENAKAGKNRTRTVSIWKNPINEV